MFEGNKSKDKAKAYQTNRKFFEEIYQGKCKYVIQQPVLIQIRNMETNKINSVLKL